MTMTKEEQAEKEARRAANEARINAPSTLYGPDGGGRIKSAPAADLVPRSELVEEQKKSAALEARIAELEAAHDAKGAKKHR